MDNGPSSLSFCRSSQRAGDSVFNISGRFAKDKTSSCRMARPSSTRCQAASNRSSASPAAPRRISSDFGIALEVVAQLLDRAEAITRVVFVHHAAPGQPVAQVVVQLDLENSLGGDHGFPQQQHMAYRTI